MNTNIDGAKKKGEIEINLLTLTTKKGEGVGLSGFERKPLGRAFVCCSLSLDR